MTLLSSFLPRVFFFFCANYCVIVTTKFSRRCGWLRFAAQPKLLFFYSGHPDVCNAIIIMIIIIINDNDDDYNKPRLEILDLKKLSFTSIFISRKTGIEPSE